MISGLLNRFAFTFVLSMFCMSVPTAVHANWWIATPPGYQDIDGSINVGPYPTKGQAEAYNSQYFKGLGTVWGWDEDRSPERRRRVPQRGTGAYGVVTIFNQTDRPVTYHIQALSGGNWTSPSQPVKPDGSYFHYFSPATQFMIEFDSSDAPGYQPKRYRLESNTVQGRTPAAADGRRYRFVSTAQGIDLNRYDADTPTRRQTPTPQDKAEDVLKEGQALYGEGRHQEAAQRFQFAQMLSPTDPRIREWIQINQAKAWERYADELARRARYADAIEAYDKALDRRRDPNIQKKRDAAMDLMGAVAREAHERQQQKQAAMRDVAKMHIQSATATPPPTRNGKPIPIGYVGNLSGEVFAEDVLGRRRLLSPGDPVFHQDKIITNLEGATQFMLLDETVFTIGPDTEMILEEFVYDPHNDIGKITANVTKGVFRFVTGKVARKKPSNMKIKLPSDALGIRGTEMIIRVDSDQSSTVTLLEGAAEVIPDSGEESVWLIPGQQARFDESGELVHFWRVDPIEAEIEWKRLTHTADSSWDKETPELPPAVRQRLLKTTVWIQAKYRPLPGKADPSSETLITEWGSGFVIDSDGLILTHADVVASVKVFDATTGKEAKSKTPAMNRLVYVLHELYVHSMWGGEEGVYQHPAKVLCTRDDPKISLVRIREQGWNWGKGLPTVSFVPTAEEQQTKPGQVVWAIGQRGGSNIESVLFGDPRAVRESPRPREQPLVNAGLVSDRIQSDDNLLKRLHTTCLATVGLKGGPLVDSQGRVMGVIEHQAETATCDVIPLQAIYDADIWPFRYSTSGWQRVRSSAEKKKRRRVLRVDRSDSDAYESIEAAFRDASSDDIIDLAPGTYQLDEPLTFKGDIWIRGAGLTGLKRTTLICPSLKIFGGSSSGLELSDLSVQYRYGSGKQDAVISLHTNMTYIHDAEIVYWNMPPILVGLLAQLEMVNVTMRPEKEFYQSYDAVCRGDHLRVERTDGTWQLYGTEAKFTGCTFLPRTSGLVVNPAVLRVESGDVSCRGCLFGPTGTFTDTPVGKTAVSALIVNSKARFESNLFGEAQKDASYNVGIFGDSEAMFVGNRLRQVSIYPGVSASFHSNYFDCRRGALQFKENSSGTVIHNWFAYTQYNALSDSAIRDVLRLPDAQRKFEEEFPFGLSITKAEVRYTNNVFMSTNGGVAVKLIDSKNLDGGGNRHTGNGREKMVLNSDNQ
jgi:hypothetical protein